MAMGEVWFLAMVERRLAGNFCEFYILWNRIATSLLLPIHAPRVPIRFVREYMREEDHTFSIEMHDGLFRGGLAIYWHSSATISCSALEVACGFLGSDIAVFEAPRIGVLRCSGFIW